jgi:hypothetical protein
MRISCIGAGSRRRVRRRLLVKICLHNCLVVVSGEGDEIVGRHADFTSFLTKRKAGLDTLHYNRGGTSRHLIVPSEQTETLALKYDDLTKRWV